MQTTAMGTVANSLPKNEIILLTLLISDWYIPYTDLQKILCFSCSHPEKVRKASCNSLHLTRIYEDFRRLLTNNEGF